jgi:hypothetical protein
MCSVLNLPPCYYTFPSHIYIMRFDTKIIHQKIQPHTCMHHVVIITIIAMLTLCYSKMSHATLILYYHASMLTLHISLTFRALWLPQA